MVLPVMTGRAMGASFQACPAPGGSGLPLEWAMEFLEPGSGLEKGLLAGVKNHQLSGRKI